MITPQVLPYNSSEVNNEDLNDESHLDTIVENTQDNNFNESNLDKY